MIGYNIVCNSYFVVFEFFSVIKKTHKICELMKIRGRGYGMDTQNFVDFNVMFCAK